MTRFRLFIAAFVLVSSTSVSQAQVDALDLDPYSARGYVNAPIPTSSSVEREAVREALSEFERTLRLQAPAFTLPDSIRSRIIDAALSDPALRDSLIEVQIALVPQLRGEAPAEIDTLMAVSNRLLRSGKGGGRQTPLTVSGSLVSSTPTSAESLTAIAGVRVDTEVGSLPVRIDLKASGTDTEGYSFDSGTRSETFTAKLGVSLAPLLKLRSEGPGLREVRLEAEGRPTLGATTRYKGALVLTYQTPFAISLDASAGYVEQRDGTSDELLQDASVSATVSLPLAIAGRTISSSLSYRHQNEVEKDESITLGLGGKFAGPVINGATLYLETSAEFGSPSITLSLSRSLYARK